MVRLEKGKKEPVRDREKLEEMKDWLLRNKSYRDFFLLFMGLNTGLRISDLLRLRVMDVAGDEIRITTQKRKHPMVIPLNGMVQNEIKKYIKQKAPSDFLFQSREGDNKAISPQMADKVLKDAARACGVENWGTHSMRKSFSYFYFKKTKDLGFLMKLLGHTSQHQTLDYIGISDDEVRDTLNEFLL